MSFDKNYITELLKKHLKGILSEEEQQTLQKWKDLRPQNKTVMKSFSDANELKKAVLETQTVQQRVWQNLENSVLGREGATYESRNEKIIWLSSKSRTRVIWAAACLCLVMGTWLMKIILQQEKQMEYDLAGKNFAVSAPTYSKAYIHLTNGTSVLLENITSEKLLTQYGLLRKEDSLATEKLAVIEIDSTLDNYNVLVNPRGSTVLDAVLSDGTKVSLNAGSSLKYPTVFSKDRRLVDVQGEVFFDIAHHSSKPFIVRSKNLEARVLGTKFNFLADDKTAVVTLFQGSVYVLPTGIMEGKQGGKKIVPGQQATGSLAGLTIQQVSVEKAISWKGSVFNFEDVSIHEAFDQIAKWYDIEVEIQSGVNQEVPFYGKINRDISLDKLLALLKTTDLKFKMDEKRKLTILKN